MGHLGTLEGRATESTKPTGRKRQPTTRFARERARKYLGAKRVRVTAVEREAYDLREQGLTWAECAARLDKDQRTIQRAYQRACVKIPKEGELQIPPQSIMARDPERYAELVDELTRPDDADQTLDDIAKRMNLPQETVYNVAKRLRSIYFPTNVEVRKVKLERLKDLWGMRAEEALLAITPEKLENAGPRDLGIIAGIATEKLLLLRGLPTQIVRNEADRGKIEILAQAFIKEAERRGYRFDADTATGRVDLGYVSRPKQTIDVDPG
ncbi:hypothetical protein AMJ82_08885 [candidate division TA06 bacterium SM23_40]|uniref:Uncharacterized protein n=1 Tax=candidate division TA06 bacterium SM23_40 TaxID=1703774 RepID=A0A0S8G533_UNCT6|nr:MAG: hypothetical protein AMJ82_08885 [candidate division TA06 bacterium SM23_40]